MTGARGPVVVGLDVGTSRAKAVAFAVDGPGGDGRRWEAERPTGVRVPEPGRHEHDPTSLVEASLGALADVVAALDGRPVAGIGVSAAMHGLVGLDAGGWALGPVLGWGDERAADTAARLRHDPALADALAATGTPLHPMSPLVKLRWLAGHDPAAHAAARWWVGIKELVLHALTGEVVVDESSASGSGLLDVVARAWSGAALDAAGIDATRLARLVPGSTVLTLSAGAAATTGLPTGTPVVAGGADGPLANLGVGAVAPGVAACSVGTSAALRVVTDRPTAATGSGRFCYVLDDRRWVVGGALGNGGSAAAWAAGALFPEVGSGPDRLRRVLDRAAAVRPGSDGLAVLPFLTGERAPLDAAGVGGTVVGLAARHGRDHLARAVVEGVARQVAGLARRVDAVHPLREVRASGGALDHPLWVEALATALPWPVRVAADRDGGVDPSALGAAAVALAAVGGAPDPDAAVERLGAPSAGLGPAVAVGPGAREALAATDALLADQLRRLAALPAGGA